MATRFGSTTLGAVLSVAGLAALGVAGYKAMSGCGACAGSEVTATMLTASTSAASAKKDGCCPLSGGTVQVSKSESGSCADKAGCSDGEKAACAGAEVKQVAAKADGCCSAKTSCEGAAEVKQVAATEAKAEGCCNAEKVCKDGKDGCTGDGKDGCCGQCKTAEKPAETTPGKGS